MGLRVCSFKISCQVLNKVLPTVQLASTGSEL